MRPATVLVALTFTTRILGWNKSEAFRQLARLPVGRYPAACPEPSLIIPLDGEALLTSMDASEMAETRRQCDVVVTTSEHEFLIIRCEQLNKAFDVKVYDGHTDDAEHLRDCCVESGLPCITNGPRALVRHTILRSTPAHIEIHIKAADEHKKAQFIKEMSHDYTWLIIGVSSGVLAVALVICFVAFVVRWRRRLQEKQELESSMQACMIYVQSTPDSLSNNSND